MDPTPIIFGAVGLVTAGVPVYYVTRAASRGGIEVNGAIGIRTRITQSSQQAWEVAHRAALPFAKAAFLLTVVCAAISVVGAVLAHTNDASGVVPAAVLIAGYVGLIVVMTLATRSAHRAVRALPPQE